MSSADPAATSVPSDGDDQCQRDAAAGGDPGGAGHERPTALARIRALWCQLVSGLG